MFAFGLNSTTAMAPLRFWLLDSASTSKPFRYVVPMGTPEVALQPQSGCWAQKELASPVEKPHAL